MDTEGFRQEYWVRVRIRRKSSLEYKADTWSVLFALLPPEPRNYLAQNEH